MSLTSLSLRRAWIEISIVDNLATMAEGRSPYGERGLKLQRLVRWTGIVGSLSLRRAWIEIRCTRRGRSASNVALLTESVD